MRVHLTPFLKRMTNYFFSILLISSLLSISVFSPTTVHAASKVKLNKTNITLVKGKQSKLKVKGTTKKVKWRSNNKKVAKVTANGIIKGIKPGTCYIYAKVNKKKLKCKVTVMTQKSFNAKQFYLFVRKKGKKGKNNTRILSREILYPTDELHMTYIVAYPQVGKISFMYNFYPCNQNANYKTTITMNIISGQEGTVFSKTSNWNPSSTVESTGTISMKYDGKSMGFTYTKIDSHYEEYNDDTAYDYTGTPPKSNIPFFLSAINDTFSSCNKLMKKYGYSMKKIGFMKWKF